MRSKWHTMHSIIRGLIVLCFAGFISISAHAAGAADGKALDAMVDKAMAGYNASDAKAFFADYAKLVAAVATETTFNAMYKGVYFQTYGKYVSRQPIKAETVLEGDTPLLVYQAEFERNKKVKISVNFIKEDGAFKVMQIQFAGM
jgi:hypothetical protein